MGGWIEWCRYSESHGWVSCSPSAPVSGTGAGFGPFPSRERGIWLVCLVVTPPCGFLPPRE